MQVFIKKKYFDAIKNGEKNCEIRHKPIDTPSKLTFLCGKYNLVKQVVSCNKLDETILAGLRQQSWWDEFCDEYIKKPSWIWRLR